MAQTDMVLPALPVDPPVTAPTRRQCVLFAGALLVLCVLAAHYSGGYFGAVSRNGDNASYAAITSFIVHGNSVPVPTGKHFWGLPYCAAMLSAFGMEPMRAIAVISLLATIGSAALAFELWSGWVSIYFIALNYTLIEFGAFGGSDPLFAFLLLVALYLMRRHHWNLAAAAISCATTVRPLGLFILGGFGLQLALTRRSKPLLLMAIVSSCILGLYAASLALRMGDALSNVHGYAAQDWQDRSPIGLPLLGLIANFRNRANIASLPMLSLKAAYVFAHMSAIAYILFRPAYRLRFFSEPFEAIGALAYSAFILSYNAPTFALSIYPRLLMPISPLFLNVFVPKFPAKWSLVAFLGLASALLAIASNVGYRRIIQSIP